MGCKPHTPKKLCFGFTWFKCNFSLQYPYTIQQTSNKITQTYHLEVVIMKGGDVVGEGEC